MSHKQGRSQTINFFLLYQSKIFVIIIAIIIIIIIIIITISLSEFG